MSRNIEETRVAAFSGLISAGSAVTSYQEVDYPQNAILIINALAAGTTWSVALSTGTATGAAGTAVTVNSLTSITGNTAGVFSYQIPNALSKYTYASISGTGTPTVGTVIVSQGMHGSTEGLTGNRPTNA